MGSAQHTWFAKLSAAVFAVLKGFHQKGFLIDKKERMEAELEFLNSVWGLGTEKE
jgi:hypothetical protein